MNCPYCGKPIEKGTISGRRDFGHVWFPEDVRYPLMLSKSVVEKKKGILLNEPTVIRPGLTAYICRECKKGVFEF